MKTTAISENYSLIDVSTHNTFEMEIADRNIGIEHQLLITHKEEEMVQTDSNKDPWTTIPSIIQSEDAQRDLSRNNPNRFARTQSEGDAAVFIPEQFD